MTALPILGRLLSPRRIGAVLLLAGLLVGSGASAAGARHGDEGPLVDVLEIEGILDEQMADYLGDTIAAAGREHAEVVVVQLDTPGGLRVSAGRLARMLASSRVPVAVWLGSDATAAGAGAFVAYGAHVLAMAPGSRLGPAVPVDLARPDAGGAGRLVGLARQRGRDLGFARAAADGDRVVVTRADGAPATGSGAVRRLSPAEVIDAHIADFTAATLPDVLRGLHGRRVTLATPDGGTRVRALDVDPVTARVRFHNLGLIRRVLHTVADPTLAYLLVVGGMLAIAFELFQPGFGVAGVCGLMLSALGVYGLAELPTSWPAFGLLVAGLVLLGADLARSGLGVLTLAGTAAFAAGSLALVDGPSVLRVPVGLVAVVTPVTVVFFVVVMTQVLRAQAGPASPETGELVGRVGVVRSMLNPEGHIWVGGSLWRARAPAESGRVATGTRVRVLGLRDVATLDVEVVDRQRPSTRASAP